MDEGDFWERNGCLLILLFSLLLWLGLAGLIYLAFFRR